MTLRFKILVAGGLAVVFGFFGWAFYAMRDSMPWARGSGAITALIVGGVLCTGALTGVLMWLAFYSARKGYDDTPTFDLADPDGPPDHGDGPPPIPSADPEPP